MTEDKTGIGTLTTANYSIKMDDTGISHIYTADEGVWIATTTDLAKAMEIVEGLILVEHKRFYHPEAMPNVTADASSVSPPFLKRKTV